MGKGHDVLLYDVGHRRWRGTLRGNSLIRPFGAPSPGGRRTNALRTFTLNRYVAQAGEGGRRPGEEFFAPLQPSFLFVVPAALPSSLIWRFSPRSQLLLSMPPYVAILSNAEGCG